MTDRNLTAAEAAEALGTTAHLLIAKARRGEVPSRKLGRRDPITFSPEDVEVIRAMSLREPKAVTALSARRIRKQVGS